MVYSRDAVEIIAGTLERSPKLSEDISFITREPDEEGQDSAVTLPLVSLQDIDTSRDDPSNSTLSGYIGNDSDERVGKIYSTKWEMTLQIDVWSVAGSDNNADDIGQQIHEILYAYDTRGPAKTFVDEDGEPVDDIYDFSLQGGSREDNLEMTPSIRRWRQEARVRGVEHLTETAEQPPVRDTN